MRTEYGLGMRERKLREENSRERKDPKEMEKMKNF
jgi:hypothetical protein